MKVSILKVSFSEKVKKIATIFLKVYALLKVRENRKQIGAL